MEDLGEGEKQNKQLFPEIEMAEKQKFTWDERTSTEGAAVSTPSFIFGAARAYTWLHIAMILIVSSLISVFFKIQSLNARIKSQENRTQRKTQDLTGPLCASRLRRSLFLQSNLYFLFLFLTFQPVSCLSVIASCFPYIVVFWLVQY